MDEEMTRTAFTLRGYRIVQSLGIVLGVAVRSRSLFGTIGATFESHGSAVTVEPTGDHPA